MPDRIIQTTQIEQLTAGDPGFRKELLTTCLEMFRAFKIDFRQAVLSGDGPEARFQLHKIKANLSMLEAESVYVNLINVADLVEKAGISDPALRHLLMNSEQQIAAIEVQLKEALTQA